MLDSNDVVVHDCLRDVSVQLHYQIYDGLPLIEKWLTVYSTGTKKLRLTDYVRVTTRKSLNKVQCDFS